MYIYTRAAAEKHINKWNDKYDTIIQTIIKCIIQTYNTKNVKYNII